jgi:cytochrome c oxidase subunit II
MRVRKDTSMGIFVLVATLLCSEAVLASPASDPAQATEFKIAARRFEFSPKTITARKGQPVKLIVTSIDTNHGFAIDDFNIDQKVAKGTTKIIEFTPDREGKFRFYCSEFCGDGHPDMEGELIVTSAQTGSESGLKVRFDESAPGVVIVESNGERVRIDTSAKTITRLNAPEPEAVPVVANKDKDVERRVSEPYDYRLVNVPTPKRVPRHSLNVNFTHRFQTPVRQDDVPVRTELEGLFGLDSFAVSSFGFTYGLTDRLYLSAYRSPLCQNGLCRTIEIGAGYHLLDEAGRSPVALSAYASIEGNDNFSEEYTYNFQAMVARSVTKYVNLFFSPAVHLNSNGQGRFNSRLGEVFPLEPEAARFELGQHTGSFGFGVNARIRPTTSLLFEYTPRVGFKLGRVEADFDPTFSRIVSFTNRSEAEIGFGIEKRLARHVFSFTFSNTQTTTTSRYNSSNLVLPPSRFTVGFNLFRRLL